MLKRSQAQLSRFPRLSVLPVHVGLSSSQSGSVTGPANTHPSPSRGLWVQPFSHISGSVVSDLT